MPKFVEMPKLSDTMTEGKVAKWFIKPGDEVVSGKAIADIETDKATMEMASHYDGVVHQIIVNEGSKAVLNSPLAVILVDGEAPPADLDALIAKAQAAAIPAPKEEKKSAAKKNSSSATIGLPIAPKAVRRASSSSEIRVKASPLARKIAEERGLSLVGIVGSGPGGRIVKSDLDHQVQATNGVGAIGKAMPTIRPAMGEKDQRMAVSDMRLIIAERLLASKTQIPHFYLQMEIDGEALMKMRAMLNSNVEKTGSNKYTVNDFILKAVSIAAKVVPAVNSAWDGDSIVQYESVGLSVAMAVADGLVTPVIKEAEKKSLLELSVAMKDLATRVKNKRLSPDEFAGGTITVSNLGAYGIDQFAAIVNPPQAAILAIGSLRKVPVVNDKGEIVVGQRMWIGLSGDHRVVDGAVAANFLAEIKKLLENPALMLI
jgi:pyruvate dehydrogenase E2 component (dihydrolipoamide acetyltransferase)